MSFEDVLYDLEDALPESSHEDLNMVIHYINAIEEQRDTLMIEVMALKRSFIIIQQDEVYGEWDD